MNGTIFARSVASTLVINQQIGMLMIFALEVVEMKLEFENG